MKNRRAFTLIELLLVIAIIGILAVVILLGVSQSRRNARIESARTTLKTALPAIITCRDNNGQINSPVAGADICFTSGAGLTGAKWPVLGNGYAYLTGAGNIDVSSSNTCFFKVSTAGDTAADLVCSCATQVCQ